MASVKVFGSPTWAEVARVLTCLFETDVKFQLIRVDTYKDQKRSPEYLKLQPEREALTVKDGGLTLVDSRAICRHIVEKSGKRCKKEQLLGAGALEQATVEQWLLTEEYSFDPPASRLVFNLAVMPLVEMKPDEGEIERSEKKLSRVLDIYEQRLEEKDFLAGDKFTLADLSHLPNAQRLVADERSRSLFEKRPRVYEWWEEISGRKSWQRVLEMQEEKPPLI